MTEKRREIKLCFHYPIKCKNEVYSLRFLRCSLVFLLLLVGLKKVELVLFQVYVAICKKGEDTED